MTARAYPELPPLERVSSLRMGADPDQQAWLLHFLMENNIEHLLNPGIVASPEQLAFMVALEEGQVYVPCADELFKHIYARNQLPLHAAYRQVWEFVRGLVNESVLEPEKKQSILALARLRYDMYFEQGLILPSRMDRRLIGIVLAQMGELDPFKKRKASANHLAAQALSKPALQEALQRCPENMAACRDMSSLRAFLDLVELDRLLRLSTFAPLWTEGVVPEHSAADLSGAPVSCECLHAFFYAAPGSKKIMFIPDTAGGLMVDMEIIRHLLRRGHKVILPLKNGFCHLAPNLWDLDEDPLLKESLGGALVLDDNAVNKNDLLRHLREHQLVVISDGTAERLNLCRVGTTFARAWKECDIIMAKGAPNAAVLLGASHSFTRDIACFWRDEQNNFQVRCRDKALWVRYFPESHINALADSIISGMRQARREGKTVMFYSAVIGSIPGQTQKALELVDAFVEHLRQQLENTYIVNPAEHFSEGLDGDDLMFMWEKVQRSGLLDVWRFQTVEDIEASFALLGRKVPSVWSGKDSTFSTGCTKEMRIALDMQKQYPELQIIGPGPEKFFRRIAYGVGKYFDSSIKV